MQILKINLGSFRGFVPLSTRCSVWCLPALSLPLSMILHPLIQDNSSSITTHCHESLSVFAAWYPQSCDWVIVTNHDRSLAGPLFCHIILWRLSVSLRFSVCWNIQWHACQDVRTLCACTLSVCECTVWSLLIYCRSLPHLSVLSFSSHRDVFPPLAFCTFVLNMFVKAAGEKQLPVPHS